MTTSEQVHGVIATIRNRARRPRRAHDNIGPTAAAAKQTLAALGDAKDVRLAFGQHGEVPLPAAAYKLLHVALKLFAKGKHVSVVAHESEITTQQAADLLMVSRSYLIGLLDAGKIPYRKLGTKRRLLAADVLSYKAKDDRRRGKLLDELAAEAQKLGLYQTDADARADQALFDAAVEAGLVDADAGRVQTSDAVLARVRERRGDST